MIHLLTLPFRLAFGLLVAVLLLPVALFTLPLLMIGLAVKTVVALAVLPIVLISTAVGLCVPVLPFAIIALCVWALTQRSRAATAGRG